MYQPGSDSPASSSLRSEVVGPTGLVVRLPRSWRETNVRATDGAGVGVRLHWSAGARGGAT
eukprot:SAG22_NODE_1135_length_5398_cov_3.581808_4_plen_60_part_01